jgi:hypothetical protein
VPREPLTPLVPPSQRVWPSGVVLPGTSVYLGKWNTPGSRAEYERVISEWQAKGRSVPGPQGTASAPSTGNGDLRVSKLIWRLWGTPGSSTVTRMDDLPASSPTSAALCRIPLEIG